LLEQRELQRNVEAGFAGKLPGKENPLNVCVATGATIGMAGVLRGRLCTAGLFCKLIRALAQ
jgi:hypothetical protein